MCTYYVDVYIRLHVQDVFFTPILNSNRFDAVYALSYLRLKRLVIANRCCKSADEIKRWSDDVDEMTTTSIRCISAINCKKITLYVAAQVYRVWMGDDDEE